MKKEIFSSILDILNANANPSRDAITDDARY